MLFRKLFKRSYQLYTAVWQKQVILLVKKDGKYRMVTTSRKVAIAMYNLVKRYQGMRFPDLFPGPRLDRETRHNVDLLYQRY